MLVETVPHLEGHAKVFGEFHRAGLHDLGPAGGHFQHFLVGQLVELARGGHDARVAGVNAVHVRKNLAKVRADGGGQGDGRQVAAAAAERGDLPGGGLTLEAGDDDDVAVVERVVDLLGGNVGDLCLRVNTVRHDARLRAGQRQRLRPEVV